MTGAGGRFPRLSRLKRRALLTPLFRRTASHTLARGTVRLLYRIVPTSEMPAGARVQVALLPGRRKGAVLRNRIRRTLREVYRLHQQDLVDLFSRRPDGLTLGILYRGTEQNLYASVARDLPPLLGQLAHVLRTEDSRNTPTGAA